MINSSPFQHREQSIGDIMSLVIMACIPGICMSTWFFGYGLIINIVLAACCALAFEAAALLLRSRSLMQLKDNSALLTAVLFAIAIPPGSPWWSILISQTIWPSAQVASHQV